MPTTTRPYSRDDDTGSPVFVMAFGIVAAACFGFIGWVAYNAPPQPSRYEVIRQCKGGSSWLTQDDLGGFHIETERYRGDVAPQNASAACPAL